VDEGKDQSYVLYTLGPDALRRTLFPLGALTKAQTREVARAAGLPLADKPDSVDICFVPGGDYRQVLAQRGVHGAPGLIERVDGAAAGQHTGIEGYTVGQRRGLGIAEGERRFVTDIDVKRNVIVIGGERDLYRRRVHAGDPHWLVDAPALHEPLRARIRYHAQEAEARVTALDDNSFTVDFATPVRAPAPGQAIVLYRGTEVVGGGAITRTEQ
jgi:tRNA-specific 2-thiouridylase